MHVHIRLGAQLLSRTLPLVLFVTNEETIGLVWQSSLWYAFVVDPSKIRSRVGIEIILTDLEGQKFLCRSIKYPSYKDASYFILGKETSETISKRLTAIIFEWNGGVEIRKLLVKSVVCELSIAGRKCLWQFWDHFDSFKVSWRTYCGILVLNWCAECAWQCLFKGY